MNLRAINLADALLKIIACCALRMAGESQSGDKRQSMKGFSF